jgi:hypothetical protein
MRSKLLASLTKPSCDLPTIPRDLQILLPPRHFTMQLSSDVAVWPAIKAPFGGRSRVDKADRPRSTDPAGIFVTRGTFIGNVIEPSLLDRRN